MLEFLTLDMERKKLIANAFFFFFFFTENDQKKIYSYITSVPLNDNPIYIYILCAKLLSLGSIILNIFVYVSFELPSKLTRWPFCAFFSWKRAITASMTRWKFTTVKQEKQPTYWTSYVVMRYPILSCLPVHVSSLGSTQISPFRTKASNWSSPSQVWHLERSPV